MTVRVVVVLFVAYSVLVSPIDADFVARCEVVAIACHNWPTNGPLHQKPDVNLILSRFSRHSQ